jgi:hypothetical protein
VKALDYLYAPPRGRRLRSSGCTLEAIAAAHQRAVLGNQLRILGHAALRIAVPPYAGHGNAAKLRLVADRQLGYGKHGFSQGLGRLVGVLISISKTFKFIMHQSGDWRKIIR